jgi:hypothetical protein
MQTQFIQQRLLDDFMCQQEGLNPNGFHQPTKRARQMSVDEDGVSIQTIASDVGDIEIMTYCADAVADRSHHVE